MFWIKICVVHKLSFLCCVAAEDSTKKHGDDLSTYSLSSLCRHNCVPTHEMSPSNEPSSIFREILSRMSLSKHSSTMEAITLVVCPFTKNYKTILYRTVWNLRLSCVSMWNTTTVPMTQQCRLPTIIQTRSCCSSALFVASPPPISQMTPPHKRKRSQHLVRNGWLQSPERQH